MNEKNRNFGKGLGIRKIDDENKPHTSELLQHEQEMNSSKFNLFIYL
jgi:hypothetical protein